VIRGDQLMYSVDHLETQCLKGYQVIRYLYKSV